jgi:hypothetical protein
MTYILCWESNPDSDFSFTRRRNMKFRIIFIILMILFLSAVEFGTAQEQASAVDDVFMNPESLVRGLYAAVSFEPGHLLDFDYVSKFFVPEVIFGVRRTRTSMAILDLEGFFDWWREDFEKHKMKERGFEETIEKIKVTVYGNIAHCFVVYKARLKTPADTPGQLGLDSHSLMKKDGRWWVVSIMNDIITPQNPLPEELR